MDKWGHCFSLDKWDGLEKQQVSLALLTRAVGASIQHLLNAMLFISFSGEQMRTITIVAQGRREPCECPVETQALQDLQNQRLKDQETEAEQN